MYFYKNIGALLHISWLYRQISNISRTLVGNKIVDHSDEIGAASTTFSLST